MAPEFPWAEELDADELVGEIRRQRDWAHGADEGQPESADVASMLQALAIYRVEPGGDPWTLSIRARREDDADVGPITVMAPTVHWTFGPGERPVSRPDPAYADDKQGDRLVAVVDTGVVHGTGKAWLDQHTGGDSDTTSGDPDIGGHGTFVCSVIHQVSARARVEIRRARPVSKSQLSSTNSQHPPPPPPPPYTSEVEVSVALYNLMNSGEHFDVLNLSVGTYAHLDLDPSRFPIPTVRTALAEWRKKFPQCAIVCAAGNEASSPYFWPAALWTLGAPFDRDFYSIDPTDCRGRVIGWDGSHPYVTRYELPNGRAWATHRVPGLDLVGLRGQQSARWSGSSFATAVASALIADGGDLADLDCRSIRNLHRE